MLSELSIRDVAIIDRAELSLEGGLTVITGETGAGKSIAVDALALALGGRAGSDLIRTGAIRAEVVARFQVDDQGAAANWLRHQELLEDADCIIRRTLDTKGSRAFVNGRPVSIQSLKELGQLLVELHGQHEHQSLLRAPVQRAVLDGYAGQSAAAAALMGEFQALSEARDRLTTLAEEHATREARRTLIEHELKELRGLNLGREEILHLGDTHRRAAHALEMGEGLSAAHAALEDDSEGARTRISAAAAHLRALTAFDRGLAPLSDRLDAILIEIDDIGHELRVVQQDIELDPAGFARIEAELAQVDRLARKHRVGAEDLPDLRDQMEQELQEWSNLDQAAEGLAARIGALEISCRQAAVRLSEARQVAANRLSARITRRLPSLGLPGARFEVRLEPLPSLTAHGAEQIEFALSANVGQEPKPLARVASGGELSRVSLALQVELAGVAAIPTLIFDEVDVGIGGAVAEIVGRELKALSRDRQVLCITHLAQVAVHGAHHYRVRKQAGRASMKTLIEPLTGNHRVQEIARMLGGIEETPQTVALASEMLRRVGS
ncbi:MAG: DNA repair protein RecN [Acidiferrobacteraceae bacterium]